MPGNWKLEKNGGFSNSDADQLQDGMRRLKMDGLDEDGSGQGGYPERHGEPDCIYYLRTGSCGYGTNCRFNHPSDGIGTQVNNVGKNANELPERTGQPDCGFYIKTGTCKYGSTCKYNHPKNRQNDSLALNVLGLPMREDAKPCIFYMRNGACKYGSTCKYHHPQPNTTTGNAVPVPIYGSPGSTLVPSGAPSAAEHSAASLSKAAYVSGSPFQLPQSYMPLVYSPSPAWNSYMGSLGPVPMSGMLNAPVSNGQLPANHLPERPDQPECKYFMYHGSCKYGSDCKYHHPRDKIPEGAFSSLGPFGLPLRPGHPICSNYNYYGLCKYGPTCKFDHPPMDGYPYAYSFNVPPLAAAYSPYHTAPLIIQSSDSSPSKSINLNNWIKTGATSSSKNQLSITNSREASPDRSESLPHSPKSSSELRQEESE